METNVTVFAKLTKKEPRAELQNRILSVIRWERKKPWLYARMSVLGAFACAAAAAAIPAGRELYSGLSHSSFIEFATLLFTDTQIILKYWQDFILALAEALPALSIVSVASSIFVFMISLRYLMKDVKSAVSERRFVH